jgi:RNA polymerase sigma factor (sigma-70 family)
MTPLLAQRPRPDRGFERLYKRYVGDVYRYALAVMRNPADAEDITQTTFLNAYRAYVEKGSRPEKPQNWLIAIAHNVCRQRFRQSARRPTEVTFDDDIADSVADDTPPTGEDIRRALGHLAFNQRAALVMRELEGRSYAEIAEILELTPSAVETLIFRARRALREQLEGSLTCGEAEFAISRQLDGRLQRRERGQLRAHLRECSDCASFARRQRAQRGALKTLALVPIPSSLTSLFGGGGAAVGTGVAIKSAAALTAGLVIGGASYEGVRHTVWQAPKPAAAVSKPQRVSAGASGAPDNRIVSTARHARGKPVVYVPGGNGHAKKAHASRGHAAQKGVRLANGHGRGNANGRQTAAAHGRAHANVHQTPQRANPASRATAAKAKHEPKANGGAQQQPSAQEKAPPPGQSKDK